MQNLLIVDDNTMNLDILKNVFKDEYRLSFAKNGKKYLISNMCFYTIKEKNLIYHG